MGINRVQFQKGLSMAEFFKAYATEAQCHEALAASRWPEGFVCPYCGEKAHSRFLHDGRTYWQCAACRRQTTVTAGTVFAATKLPLTVWFLAMHLLTQAKKRRVGAGTVAAPGGALQGRMAGQAEADAGDAGARGPAPPRWKSRDLTTPTWVGERIGGKAGRGSENKVPFVAAVQTTPDGQAVLVRYDPIPFTRVAVEAWAKGALAATAEVVSDGLACFGGVIASGALS